jgi:hypothetical protein
VMLEYMKWRQAALQRFVAYLQGKLETGIGSSNTKPEGSKTLAIAVPAEVRVRIEALQEKFGAASFAKAAGAVLLIGLETLDGSRTGEP